LVDLFEMYDDARTCNNWLVDLFEMYDDADHHLVWPSYNSLQHFYLIQLYIISVFETPLLKHCGRVTQICVFNTVKLGTSASSP